MKNNVEYHLARVWDGLENDQTTAQMTSDCGLSAHFDGNAQCGISPLTTDVPSDRSAALALP